MFQNKSSARLITRLFWSAVAGTLRFPVSVLLRFCPVLYNTGNGYPFFTLKRFASLDHETQFDELARHGIALRIIHKSGAIETLLFAYADFYVVLVIDQCREEAFSITCHENSYQAEMSVHRNRRFPESPLFPFAAGHWLDSSFHF